jgi:hypothetical protein
MWHVSLPATLRATVMVAAFSQFEAGFAEVCRVLESDNDVPKRHSWDTRPSCALWRAKEYFWRNFSIRLSDHETWGRITDYYQVRNCIVHAHGDIGLLTQSKQQRTKEAIAHLRVFFGAGCDDCDIITVEMTLLRKQLKDMQSLWEELECALADNEVVGPVFWP